MIQKENKLKKGGTFYLKKKNLHSLSLKFEENCLKTVGRNIFLM